MASKFPKPYENKIKKLKEFKNRLVLFSQLNSQYGTTKEEKIKITELREYLNQNNTEIAELVLNSGLSTEIFYQPPPAVGGLATNVDIFANLFNLHLFQMSFTQVLDTIDMAIGRYEFMQKRFWYKRLLNPIYWIGEIIRIPFRIVSFAGFNATKIEFSFLGKIYKLIAGFLTLIGGLWAIVQILEYIGIDVKNYINIIK